ncbi:MAG TPA: nuclear transport factor 2 family protein [Solirubrobacteraceae bacterium]|nr:nuclear transport factor 2 family protein [Solirubrobacteraceae bacterium]
MFDAVRITEQYLAVWNETDPAQRRRRLEEGWSDQALYVDPMVSASGREQIDQMIATVQAQFPGFAFHLAGAVDAHHQQLRFGWELGPGAGPAPVAGFDVVVCDADGRIEQVRGFLDRVPEG